MTERYVCLHGHFYQPPRESPWLEAVEVQDSAYPYHDWNERVTAECYAPNAAARILDGDGRIARIVDNYSRISFDFGPTLLAWMETARPDVHRAVLEADRRSAERFSGHGSAMAQAYGHLILPLASRRDKETQVLWGIRDFEHRFGRRPEGMWLPETAVDTETLEVLAEHGIAFTVLAPHQAARVRKLDGGEPQAGREIEGGDPPAQPRAGGRPAPPSGAVPSAPEPQGDERPTEREAAGAPGPPWDEARADPDSQGDERPTQEPWHDVPDASIDPTRPYLCRLPSGRSIALFFYDGGLAQELAFGDLLRDGESFAQRLLAGGGDGPGPRLVHAATDGETYGHHHRHGEMALAYALDRLEEDPGVRLTNYAELLARHPPQHEVEIVEASSWSCAHGVERWRSDCGCHTGGEPGWTQAWRRPLREALDWLRDELAPRYEEAAGELFRDPWAARNDAVELVLDRSEEALGRFLDAHAVRELEDDELVRARRLLELQRHAMTMFTSCGWFFNDLAGIETVQVLHYAGRALQLGRALFGDDLADPLEDGFLARLEAARSNRPGPHGGTGREIFEGEVAPAEVTLERVGAHYALSSLFEDYPEETRIFCYRADQREVRTLQFGRARLALGRFRVASLVTGAREELAFAVLHFGDHNLSGGVRQYRGREELETTAGEVGRAFRRGDLAGAVRVLDRHFEMTYSLDSLFRDERRAVLDLILAATRADAEERHRRTYEEHAPLMQYLAQLGIPLPPPLKASAEVFLNLELRRAFEDPSADLEGVDRVLRETATWHLELDTAGLSHALEGTLEGLARALEAKPDDLALLERLQKTAELAAHLPFQVSLYGTQDVCYRLLQDEYPTRRAAAEACDPAARAWTERFRTVAEALHLRVE